MNVQETPGDATGRIDFDQILSPAEIADEAAKQLVVQDARNTKSWIESRYFNIRWIETDFLYQSPPSIRTWEGTSTPRANISKFTIATHVNAINSKLLGGLFYEQPAFKLRTRSGADQNAIRAIETIHSFELDEMQFETEVKYGFFSCLLNGTGIWKWGWKEYYEDEVDYVPVAKPLTYNDPATGKSVEVDTDESDRFVMVNKRKLKARPFFENCDIRHVLVSPGCRTPDIRDAQFVIHEFAATYRDLIRMADEVFYDQAEGKLKKRYNLPSENEIREWFRPPVSQVPPMTTGVGAVNNSNFVQHAAPVFQATTADPLDEPLEILERWDKDKVITVLQQCRVIRNEPNPFGCIPFFSVNWWMIQDCFWGIGLGTALGGEQRLQQGFINAVADIGTLAANQPIIRARGANINTQQVRARLGGFIDVDGDATKALHPMDLPKIQGEMFEIVAASEARTESTSGANELLTMGATPSKGKTSMGRTATGAGGLIQAAVDRLGGLVEDFNRQVYQPFLWKMHDMNRKFLPAEVYRNVLAEKLGTDFRVSIQDYMRTGKTGVQGFDVLAGSHLAAKQQMAQSLPLIMQYFMNPALAQQVADINGEYIDYSELMHMLTDSSGWGNFYSILKPLTDEMKKQRAANNPAAQKAQASAQQNQQKFIQKSQLQDQAWTERAAGDIIRHSLEAAGSSQAIQGEPGGTGFGGQELES